MVTTVIRRRGPVIRIMAAPSALGSRSAAVGTMRGPRTGSGREAALAAPRRAAAVAALAAVAPSGLSAAGSALADSRRGLGSAVRPLRPGRGEGHRRGVLLILTACSRARDVTAQKTLTERLDVPGSHQPGSRAHLVSRVLWRTAGAGVRQRARGCRHLAGDSHLRRGPARPRRWRAGTVRSARPSRPARRHLARQPGSGDPGGVDGPASQAARSGEMAGGDDRSARLMRTRSAQNPDAGLQPRLAYCADAAGWRRSDR